MTRSSVITSVERNSFCSASIERNEFRSSIVSKKVLRVVYFGSSQNVFSQRYFEALAETSCDIAAIVDVPTANRSSSNPTKGEGLNYAADAACRGVPVHEPANPNVPEFVAAIRALEPDLFLAVGYMFRLKAEILAIPRIVAANVHASLLPAYRGRSPVFWALRHGEPESGLSIHSMDQELDRGDLLYQVRVRTRKNDTVASLYDRIIAKGLKLVPKLIADAGRGQLPRIPTLDMTGSYFSAPKETDFCLDWSHKSEELRRWIVMTPGQRFINVHGQPVFFLDAKIAAYSRKTMPGTLLKTGPRSCTIATGDGALRIGMIRVQTGEPMPMPQFCRLTGMVIGDYFGDSIPQDATPRGDC
jgi:methionyl-tRNA formyltransferase